MQAYIFLFASTRIVTEPNKICSRSRNGIGNPWRLLYILYHDGTYIHFWHRHFRDTMVILLEGNLPHPWCAL